MDKTNWFPALLVLYWFSLTLSFDELELASVRRKKHRLSVGAGRGGGGEG